MEIKIRTEGSGWAMVPIDRVIPYGRNAKIHGQEQIEKLRESLRAFGFVRPLLVDENMTLLAGHGMLAAAKAEGMTCVPCVSVVGLDDAQKRAYIHVDNKLAELAEWDYGLLNAEISDLSLHGIDMESLGFDLPESDIDLDFEPFDGQGDGGGSQITNGTKFRVVLGPLMFDLEDKDHSLYSMAKNADVDAVKGAADGFVRKFLGGVS